MTARSLPSSPFSPLLRTDFTDERAWHALLEDVGTDWLTVMPDRQHRGLTVPELVALVPPGSYYPVLAVADKTTFTSAERPLLLVDVVERPGRTFRAAPEAFRYAIGNLTFHNQRFKDYYLDGLDGSGVYRLPKLHDQASADLPAFNQPGEVAAPVSR
ncbi:DUF6924 domain-containing protein [Lentzea sp.]|uniref:DUF6924 domain-containing protein n=1 Tax=Lentzea sp. TaxID=56099 RepID=UPI002ED06A41